MVRELQLAEFVRATFANNCLPLFAFNLRMLQLPFRSSFIFRKYEYGSAFQGSNPRELYSRDNNLV